MKGDASMRNVPAAAAIPILLLLLVFAGGASAQELKGGSYTKIPTVKGIDILKAGGKAPDFSVKDLEGKEFRLRDSLDKDATLLFFWSYFCKGLQVVGVDLDGREMKKVIDKMVVDEKVSFRILFDELDGEEFRIADPYGVSGTPALFLIDRKGVITFSVVGAVTAERLRKEIAKVVE